jgi:hypothetical protein
VASYSRNEDKPTPACSVAASALWGFDSDLYSTIEVPEATVAVSALGPFGREI